MKRNEIDLYPLSSELMNQDWCLYSDNDTSEFNDELIYTYQLCNKYNLDFLTVLAIRATESQFQSNIKSCDYWSTGSRGTFQQTRDNIDCYGLGYSENEIAKNNYKSTEAAINYIVQINKNMKGEYRRIIAFNTGITGAMNLSWNGVENHSYLNKVLEYKRKIETIYNKLNYEK
jgi:hypothetical protein